MSEMKSLSIRCDKEWLDRIETMRKHLIREMGTGVSKSGVLRLGLAALEAKYGVVPPLPEAKPILGK